MLNGEVTEVTRDFFGVGYSDPPVQQTRLAGKSTCSSMMFQLKHPCVDGFPLP